MNNDKSSQLEELLDQDWAALRSVGRSRFIWRRVFVGGLPLGVIMAIAGFLYVGYSPADLISRRGAALAYTLLMLSVLATVVAAVLEWSQREQKYRMRRKRNEKGAE